MKTSSGSAKTMVMMSYLFEFIPHLPEGMTDSTIPLHRYGQGEVDGPGQPHLGHGQEHGEHVQVGGVGPKGGHQTWQAEYNNGQADIQQVKCSKSKHKVMEALEGDFSREPADADGVANNTNASN